MAKNSLVAVIAIVVVVAAVFYLYQYRPGPAAQQPTQTKLTGLEIAEKTAVFVFKTKGDDGLYQSFINCDVRNGPNCNGNFYDATMSTNSLAMEAYNALFESTRDTDYKTASENESLIMAQRCFSNSSAYLACGDVLHTLIAEYKSAGKPEYLGILNSIEKALTDSTNLQDPNRKGKSFINLKSADASIKLYEFNKNEDIRKAAESYLNLVDETDTGADADPNGVLYSSNGIDVYSISCEVKGAMLDLFSATQNKNYLDKAKNFFDAARISDNAQKLQSSSAVLHCAEALEQLSKIMGETKYDGEAVSLLQYLVTNYWDYEERPKFNGDNGFLASQNNETNEKDVIDSAVAVILFSKVGDNEFVVSQ